MCEVWKDINNYEGMYQVSNKGRVRSLDRFADNGVFYKGKMLKPYIKNTGYVEYRLSKNSKHKAITGHRLVAEAFIFNGGNLPCINHIDENKSNNNADNLEWCTVSYNNTYSDRMKRVSKSMSIAVYQYDLELNFIRKWASTNEVQKVLGYSNSGIVRCCNMKIKNSRGYIWSYSKLTKEDAYKYKSEVTLEAREKMSRSRLGHKAYNFKRVVCVNTGEVFNSCSEADRKKGFTRGDVAKVCRNERNSRGKDEYGKPLKWMFYDDYLEMVNN